jgi:arginase
MPNGNLKIRILGIDSALGAPEQGTEAAPPALRQLGLLEAVQHSGCSAVWANDLLPDAGLPRWAALGALLRDIADQTFLSIIAGTKPLVVGGDHSIAAGTWRGVGRALGIAPGLLWIDTHLDAHTPATSPSGNPHGMPLAALLGHGEEEMTAIAGPALDPRYVAILGSHSFEAEELAFLQKLGVRIFSTADIARDGFAACFAAALDIVRQASTGFGVSVDIDVVDPSEAPGVSTPAPHGVHGEELRNALQGLLRLPDCVGAELVEYEPWRDINQRTGRLAVALAGNLCALRPQATIAA